MVANENSPDRSTKGNLASEWCSSGDDMKNPGWAVLKRTAHSGF